MDLAKLEDIANYLEKLTQSFEGKDRSEAVRQLCNLIHFCTSINVTLNYHDGQWRGTEWPKL